MREQSSSTDWDAYYESPAPTARLTRMYTQRRLLELIRQHAPQPSPSICELGGANSCFYDAIRAAFPDSYYTAIDNNTRGLQLLDRRAATDSRTQTMIEDVTRLPDGRVNADVVFSVGLIEHFGSAQTASVIERHFACARPRGLVIITFPTPTWLYQGTRRLAEAAGLWRFPDERPLTFKEVLATVRRHGTVLTAYTNWPIVLTQGVVAVRAWEPWR